MHPQNGVSTMDRNIDNESHIKNLCYFYVDVLFLIWNHGYGKGSKQVCWIIEQYKLK